MSNTEVIDSFSGKYRFLSNFAPCKVVYDGIEYPSVEHAYQAAKSLSTEIRRFIKEAETPGEAKKRGQKVKLRDDWETLKLEVMESLLRSKFNQSDFRRALLKTENAELVEGNNWKDVYWGVFNGKGQNHLGKLLMKIRAELK